MALDMGATIRDKASYGKFQHRQKISSVDCFRETVPGKM